MHQKPPVPKWPEHSKQPPVSKKLCGMIPLIFPFVVTEFKNRIVYGPVNEPARADYHNNVFHHRLSGRSSYAQVNESISVGRQLHPGGRGPEYPISDLLPRYALDGKCS